MTDKPKSKRGFASMDADLRREIARKGGAATPPEKRSFSRDRELAKAAASLGARVKNRKGKTDDNPA